MTDARMEDALRLRRQGRFAEAAQIYDDVLRGEPRHFAALHGLGLVRYQSGQLEDAERLIGEAVAANPSAADALYNRASILLRLGRLEDAALSFDRAIALKPDYIEALVNRGAVRLKQNRTEEALADFTRVTALKPGIAEAWFNRGGALFKLKRYAEAGESFARVVALKPEHAEAWTQKGYVAAQLGAPAEAADCYSRALALKSGDVDLLAARADALMLAQRFEDAIADYRAMLAAAPDYDYARGNLALAMLYLCDWRSLEEVTAGIAKGAREGKKVLPPFANLVLSERAGTDVLAPVRQWSTGMFPASPSPLWSGERYGHERIRVAYVSADFRQHAVARLMAGVFEHHDKSRFETIAISLGPGDDGAMRARLMRAFDRFIDAQGMGEKEVAAMLRAMEVDIAVDLMGYTANCRPGIFAMRAAPVQVNYLGFPGSSGADYMDYVLGDATVTPFGHKDHFSERIVQLPHSYLPNDAKRPIAVRTPTRAEAGLPEKGFVFCCFNNGYKFFPEMFDVWMRILREVDGSVLWMSQTQQVALGNLRREAAARGVAPERLVPAPFAPSDEDHLARLRLADLFLDTLPYNAHTTAADALWAGTPVLTCAGRSFQGRVAASLLRAAGIAETIADSLDAYEALALRLAADKIALSAIKAKLAAQRGRAPLFDTARFTRNLEAAFAAMWRRSERGLAPEAFAVAEGAGT